MRIDEIQVFGVLEEIDPLEAQEFADDERLLACYAGMLRAVLARPERDERHRWEVRGIVRDAARYMPHPWRCSAALRVIVDRILHPGTIKSRPFCCPACRGKEIGGGANIDFSPSLSWQCELEKLSPLLKVWHKQLCAGCGRFIPAHIGERWSGQSLDRAAFEYWEFYAHRPRVWTQCSERGECPARGGAPVSEDVADYEPEP